MITSLERSTYLLGADLGNNGGSGLQSDLRSDDGLLIVLVDGPLLLDLLHERDLKFNLLRDQHSLFNLQIAMQLRLAVSAICAWNIPWACNIDMWVHREGI